MTASSLRLGEVALFLPDASDPDFWFEHDIAGMLGFGTTAEALSALEHAIAEDAQRPRGKLAVDREADSACFRARSPAPVVHAVQVLHRLAEAPLPADDITLVLQKARAWRRPKPRTWKVGDIFTITLTDGALAFGQVVGSHGTGPTVLLFEGHAATPLLVHDTLELGFITVLHTDGTCLDSGEFVVLGNGAPSVDPASGPWGRDGTSTSDVTLQRLANAWYGLEPWNVLHREDYWDRLLYRGRARPASAVVLSPAERAEYRREHFGVDE